MKYLILILFSTSLYAQVYPVSGEVISASTYNNIFNYINNLYLKKGESLLYESKTDGDKILSEEINTYFNSIKSYDANANFISFSSGNAISADAVRELKFTTKGR